MTEDSPRDSMTITREESLHVERADVDIEKVQTGASTRTAAHPLDLVQSHISHQDMHAATSDYGEANAEQYLRFSPARKIVIVAILSFCSFLAPISSTSILSAIPEVAKTFDTTGSIINASNALYMAFMGISASFWGPLSQVWGRRPVSSPQLCCLVKYCRLSYSKYMLIARSRFALPVPSYSLHSASGRHYLPICLPTSYFASSLPSKGHRSWS